MISSAIFELYLSCLIGYQFHVEIALLENFYLSCVTGFEAQQPWEHVVNDCRLDAGNANCFMPCTQKVFLLPAVRTGM